MYKDVCTTEIGGRKQGGYVVLCFIQASLRMLPGMGHASNTETN